ncbi:MAG: copper chaperone PCu(A)C [Hyphomicrobiaceae bacterium]
MHAFVLGLLACLVGLPALAHGVKTRTIDISHPWTYGTQTSGGDVEVYARIRNIGRAPDRLVGARTSLSRSAEIVVPASTAPAPAAPAPSPAIDIRPGAAAELLPEKQRIVLRAFSKALAPYDTFKLTLVFERAGRVDVEVLVEER